MSLSQIRPFHGQSGDSGGVRGKRLRRRRHLQPDARPAMAGADSSSCYSPWRSSLTRRPRLAELAGSVNVQFAFRGLAAGGREVVDAPSEPERSHDRELHHAAPPPPRIRSESELLDRDGPGTYSNPLQINPSYSVVKQYFVNVDDTVAQKIVVHKDSPRGAHFLRAGPRQRAYPFKIEWSNEYADTTRSLVVDIGSGNGLFLLEMARRRKDLNFLGLEINKKLVRRCLDSVCRSGIKNGFFIATNATSTFRSIVSSYPGKLVLVSIQCPNPDFNKPGHRWRMLQRSLVEAIVDLLSADGKVFLQSDIEVVALRMKEQFLKYSKGKLSIVHDQDDLKTNEDGWHEENPFGVRSDWEQHVMDRGAPMYRLMLSKSTSTC